MTGAHPFSLEAVIIGRNDDYEPNWSENLQSCIAYNRALFAGSRVDFRVAFVEYNPPPGRPLLAPLLTRRFDCVRAVVIDPAIHQALVRGPGLNVLLSPAFNAGFRTSTADFMMTTCGDIFFGRALARRIIEEGLSASCLYRAERVSIRRDLDFRGHDGDRPDGDRIEDPANIVKIDSCREPPYDRPPYSNACGDFTLMDRARMHGIRGFDEAVRDARLHLDSRCCLMAMELGCDCTLLGSVYHISHSRSFTNMPAYPGRPYDHSLGLPYLNPESWGLADHAWSELAPRILAVAPPGTPGTGRPFAVADCRPPRMRAEADAVTATLRRLRRTRTPPAPEGPVTEVAGAISVAAFRPDDHLGDGSVVVRPDGLRITTSARRWAYAAWAPLRLPAPPDARSFTWLCLTLEVTQGTIGIGLQRDSGFGPEIFAVAGDGRTRYTLPLPDGIPESLTPGGIPENVPENVMVIIRNIEADRPSVCDLFEVVLVSAPRPDAAAGDDR